MLTLGLQLRQRGAFNPRMLFTGGTAGAWYDPADLASMSQNSDGTGAAAVGAPVGRILDKSGRGNHAVQASAASRPMLREDAAGCRYLEFDGVDDFLAASFAVAQPWERISALRQISWTDLDYLFANSASALVGLLYQRTTLNQVRIASGQPGPITSGQALGVNIVTSERHSGVNSRLAVNGGPFAAGDAGTSAPQGISIGASNTGTNAGHFRLYGTCMVGRTLSDSEANRLRRFMAARAAISL